MRRLPDDFRPTTPSRRLVVRSADGTRLAVEIHGEDPGGASPNGASPNGASPNGASRGPGPIPRPTVVLVHGWTCSASFWVRIVHRLRGEARVVVYDQRGHGRSQAVCEGGFTTAALADDLAAVLTATVPDGERVVVAGHSMGAMSIVALAGRHPDVLRDRVRAALLASTGIAELTGRLAVLPSRAPRAQAALARYVVERPAEAPPLRRLPLPLVRAAVSRVALSPAAAAAERAYTTDMVLACPPETYSGFAHLLATLDLRDDLAKLDVPTLVLVGAADRLTPPWHAHQMAKALPRPLGLVEVAAAGHMTPLTVPDAVADAIRSLLRAGTGEDVPPGPGAAATGVPAESARPDGAAGPEGSAVVRVEVSEGGQPVERDVDGGHEDEREDADQQPTAAHDLLRERWGSVRERIEGRIRRRRALRGR